MFIVAFPVLVVVSMAHASFVDLPVWRDRPPSKAFFDFNRYEYRLQLCTNCCRMRYRGLQQDAGGLQCLRYPLSGYAANHLSQIVITITDWVSS